MVALMVVKVRVVVMMVALVVGMVILIVVGVVGMQGLLRKIIRGREGNF